MKIHKILLENLHSLRGRFELNFEAAPLNQSGLFVISGPTGAGKSTLLDAITLALYGQVFRTQGGGNFSIAEAQEAAVSRGEKSAMAELEYSIEGRRYRSSWALGQTRTGNFRAAERRLEQLETSGQWRTLADKTKEVKTQTENLLKLDFEQFVHTVVLAQGEFSAFLAGGKDKRAEILARLTNSQRYVHISQAAHQRHKQAKKQLEHLELRLNQLGQGEALPSLEALDTLLEDQAPKEIELKTAIEGFRQGLELYQQLSAKRSAWLENKQKYETKQAEAQSLQGQRQNLARYDLAASLRPAYDLVQDIVKQGKETRDLIAPVELRLKEAQEKAPDYQAKDEKTAQALQAAEAEYKDQEPRLRKAMDLDKEALVLTDSQKRHRAKVQDIEAKLQAENQKLQKLGEDLEVNTQRQRELQNWLESQAVLGTLAEHLPNWTGRLEILKERQIRLTEAQKKTKKLAAQVEAEAQKEAQLLADKVQVEAQFQAAQDAEQKLLAQMPAEAQAQPETWLAQALEQARQFQRQHEDWLTLRQSREEAEIQIAQLENALKQLLDQQAEAEKNLEDWALTLEQYRIGQATVQAQLRFHEHNAQLEAYREDLQAGKPCPLCHATEHPILRDPNYQAHQGIQQAKQELAEWDSRIQRLDSDMKSLDREQTQLKSQVELNGAKREQIRKGLIDQAQTLQNRWPDLDWNAAQAPQALSQAADKLVQLQALEQAYRQALQSLQKAKAQHDTQESAYLAWQQRLNIQQQDLMQQQADCDKQSRELKDFEADLNQSFKPWGTWDKPEQALQALQNQAKTWENQQKASEELHRQIQRDQERQAEAHSRLVELGNDLESEQRHLGGVEQKMAQNRSERQTLSQEAQPEQALKTLEQQLEDCRQAANLAHSRWIELQTALDKDNEQLAALKQKIEGQKANYKLNLAALNEAAQKQGFEGGEPELKALFEQDAHTLNQQRQKIQALDQVLHSLSEQQQGLATEIAQVQAALEGQAPKEVLQAKFDEYNSHLKDLMEERGRLQAWRRQREELDKQLQQLEAELENHKREVNRWALLDRLIGSSDGKVFSTFAQSLTLAHLIQLANRHLRHFLQGRYRLVAPGGEDLELFVLDKFQAHNQRSIKTLSGGETFLVSLALALALSDLSGGEQLRIESLFIDEGFGSLDSETLRTAIIALQALESQGKTIGIISHVDQLKQSVQNQLRLVKGSDGFSRLLF